MKKPAPPRCERLLSHIPAYEEMPLQCTLGAAHNLPHVYDPAELPKAEIGSATTNAPSD